MNSKNPHEYLWAGTFWKKKLPFVCVEKVFMFLMFKRGMLVNNKTTSFGRFQYKEQKVSIPDALYINFNFLVIKFWILWVTARVSKLKLFYIEHVK